MKKMMNKIWDAICTPFVAIAVLIDESKIANEDGSWDGYHEKKNRKGEKR
jgi:hypothetical protein